MRLPGLIADGRLICRGWNGSYGVGFGAGTPGYCGAVTHAMPLRIKNCGYVDGRRMRAENKRLTHAAACGSGALPKRPRCAGMIRIRITFAHSSTMSRRICSAGQGGARVWRRGPMPLTQRRRHRSGLSLPHDDAGREALGAILSSRWRTRGRHGRAGTSEPSHTNDPRRGASGGAGGVLLDGRALAGAPGGAGHAIRILAVERRRDGRIARLVAASDPALAEAGPVAAAKM